jgi:hypothetical protein
MKVLYLNEEEYRVLSELKKKAPSGEAVLIAPDMRTAVAEVLGKEEWISEGFDGCNPPEMAFDLVEDPDHVFYQNLTDMEENRSRRS